MATQVGQRIRLAREAKGLNREKLAVRIDKSLSSIARYEQGLSEPSIEVLRRIADETGKPLSFFVAEEVAA